MDPDGTAPYTIWTQTILLLWEQSDLGPYCLYLEQSDLDSHRLSKRLSKTFNQMIKADNFCCDLCRYFLHFLQTHSISLYALF